MYPNYINKPSFMTNTSTSGFGASTSTFGQPTSSTSMFPSIQPTNIFQNPNTSTFNTGPTNQPGFGDASKLRPRSESPRLRGRWPVKKPYAMPVAPNIGFQFGAPAQQSGMMDFFPFQQNLGVSEERRPFQQPPYLDPHLRYGGPTSTSLVHPTKSSDPTSSIFGSRGASQTRIEMCPTLDPNMFKFGSSPGPGDPRSYAYPDNAPTPPGSPSRFQSILTVDAGRSSPLAKDALLVFTGSRGSTLFGQQQQPSTSGLFGSTNAFGQNKPTFGFGSTPNQTGLFGQQPQQQTGSSLFQSNTPNLFGSGNAFGNQAQTGTVVKFSPVTGTDTMQKNGVAQSISTKHHCITCMKEYENKSLEELRFEDYSCNRKGPQQQAGFAAPPFGATTGAAPTSLFGQNDNKQTGFGQPTGFGQTSTFGQNTTGFGMTNQTTSAGLFGKPPGFGAPTSNTTSTFGFNQPPSTSNPFNANQAAKPFSQPLFGAATTQAQPSFGTGGVFGQTANQNAATNLFSKPAQPATGFNTGQAGFSFNQTTTTQAPNLFQVPKPNTGFGIFGQTTPATNTFGQTNQSSFGTNFGKPTNTFGQPTQTGFGTNLGGGLQQQSLFGNTAAKPTNLFGNASTGTNIFSNNVFQPTTAAFPLNVTQQQPVQFPPEPADEFKNISLVATDTFPDGPHIFGLDPIISDPSKSTTNPKDIKAMLEFSKKRDELQGTGAKIKVQLPRPKRGSNYNKEFFECNQALKSSRRCLVIRKFNETNNTIYNKYNNELLEEAEKCLKEAEEAGQSTTDLTASKIQTAISPSTSEYAETVPKRDSEKHKKFGLRLQFDNTSTENTDDNKINRSNYVPDESSISFTPPVASSKANLVLDEDSIASEPETEAPSTGRTEVENIDNPAHVVMSKPEYYMYPDLKDLQQYMNENGECIVEGLTIGRRGYGSIHFEEPINITGLNFDDIIHFRYREVVVYPDDSKKPPVGEGLNRPAQVTLDKIFPREKGTNKYITDFNQIIQSNFVDNLMHVTQKHNCKFIDYRPRTGSWVFKVKHFSKYGFTDSDEEECELSLENNKMKQPEHPLKQIEEDVSKIVGLGAQRVLTPEMHSMIELPDAMDDDSSGLPMDLLSSDKEVSSAPNSYAGLGLFKTNLYTTKERTSKEQSSKIFQRCGEVISTPKVHKLPNLSVVAISDEKVKSAQRCYIDLGLFKNNNFKVGWKRGCTFYNVNMFYDNEVVYALTSYDVQVESDNDYNIMMPNLIDMLQITLEESDLKFDSNNIPTASIKKDLLFLQKQTLLFNDHVRKEKLSGKYRYLSGVWNLCTALWGEGDNSPYVRRQYFSDWLKRFAIDTASEYELGEISNRNQHETFDTIFQHLSFNRVAEACEFASKNNLNELSLLISQLSMNERCKHWMRKYTRDFIWKERGVIPDEYKKIYLLLTGLPVNEEINICERLDWIRCLGLHLWYISASAAPIDVAFNQYKRAFQEYGYATKPNPPYMDQVEELIDHDLIYHILNLYVESTYQLCYVLHPATHTENIMDYRFSWVLFQLFSSLHVGLSKQSEEDNLHTTFSNQLESMGEWKWAIFVLLFLKNNLMKKNLIMKILERNIDFDNETLDVERELVTIFKIPASWIHEVKAVRAKITENHYEYFQHSLYREDWQEANRVFITNILPELFINEQYGYLVNFIKKLEPISNTLSNWINHGQLFKDFIELNESLHQNEETSVNLITSNLYSLCRRINYFPLKNDEQRLCIAELSRKCALLFKILYKNLDANHFQTKFVDIINDLIMPPDYKHFEIFYLISRFVYQEQLVH